MVQPTDEAYRRFLEIDYQESHKDYLQIESTMHDLLKSYSLLILGLISATIAIYELVRRAEAQQTGSIDVNLSLFLLWSAFVVVGLVLLHAYFELRMRKIRMVEQLASYRSLYPDLPTRLAKSIQASPLISGARVLSGTPLSICLREMPRPQAGLFCNQTRSGIG